MAYNDLPPLGQDTMANSLPVVIASNQSAVPVSATNLDIRDLTFAADKVDASGTVLGAGTNNIGDVDVVSSALPTGAATLAEQQTQTASLSVLDDWDNAASDGASVSGDVAHDSADAGEPVKIGGKGLSADPTAVATADRVNALFDLLGKQVVLPYAIPESAVSGAITTAMTGTTSTSLVAAPGSGLRNYITTIIVSNAHGTVGTDVIIQDGVMEPVATLAALAFPPFSWSYGEVAVREPEKA